MSSSRDPGPENLRLVHARFQAAKRALDGAGADEAALARVEAAAGAVMRVPATDATGAALKLGVLRTWYLADFWTDACWDDAAAEAVRTAFAEIDAMLEPPCERARRLEPRRDDVVRGDVGFLARD